MREHCETHCREASAEWDRVQARKAELLAAGEFVRSSAIGRDYTGTDGQGYYRVAVTFENAQGVEAFAEMSRETYHSIPLLTPATPADYGVVATVLG
jgi:hypothetical protein